MSFSNTCVHYLCTMTTTTIGDTPEDHLSYCTLAQYKRWAPTLPVPYLPTYLPTLPTSTAGATHLEQSAPHQWVLFTSICSPAPHILRSLSILSQNYRIGHHIKDVHTHTHTHTQCTIDWWLCLCTSGYHGNIYMYLSSIVVVTSFNLNSKNWGTLWAGQTIMGRVSCTVHQHNTMRFTLCTHYDLVTWQKKFSDLLLATWCQIVKQHSIISLHQSANDSLLDECTKLFHTFK